MSVCLCVCVCVCVCVWVCVCVAHYIQPQNGPERGSGERERGSGERERVTERDRYRAVSYTHLTLPTRR